jgi:hypothetical protein
MINKIWNLYMTFQVRFNEVLERWENWSTTFKRVRDKNDIGAYSIIDNKWVKKCSLNKVLLPLKNELGYIYVGKYKKHKQDKQKVISIYDKELKLLVEDIPEWFKFLFRSDWKILLKKKSWEDAEEDFIVMSQWSNRKEKKDWEVLVKDTKVYQKYIDYINKADNK